MSEPVIWAFTVPDTESEIQALSVLVEVLERRVGPEARIRILDYLSSRFCSGGSR